MKKFKKVLLPLISLVCAMALIFSVACKAGNGDGQTAIVEKEVLTSLAVSGGKTAFNRGEAFSADDLVVTATFVKDSSTGGTAQVTEKNVTDSAVIDSDAYVADKIGVYPIYVSYTFGGITRNAEYNVSVSSTLTGHHQIEVVKDKTLYESTPAADFTTDDIKVYEVDEDGLKTDGSDAITNKDVTAASRLEYYKGDKKLAAAPDGTKGGTYQVWAFNDYVQNGETYTRSDFVMFYIKDDLTSIAPVTDSSVITEIEAGSSTDEMVASWKFTVTYQSGNTEVVSGDDSAITIDGLTKFGDGQIKVTVTYRELIVGEPKTVTCNMTYTIKGNTTELTDSVMWDAKYDNNFNGTYSKSSENGLITLSGVDKGTGTGNATYTDGFETSNNRIQMAGDQYIKISVPANAIVTVKVWFFCGTSKTSDDDPLAEIAIFDTHAISDTPTKKMARGPELAYASAHRNDYKPDGVNVEPITPGELTVFGFDTYYLKRIGETSVNVHGIQVSVVIPPAENTIPVKFHETDDKLVTQYVLTGDYATQYEGKYKKWEKYYPEREGFTFDNWYTAKEGGEAFNFRNPITQSVELWARWNSNI